MAIFELGSIIKLTHTADKTKYLHFTFINLNIKTMKTTIKLSIFLLIFTSYSCSKNTEIKSILAQNTASAIANITTSARTSPIVNTIALRNIVSDIGKQPLFMVSFSSETLAERKGWDGSVKGGNFNFVLDQSGTIVTELSPDDVAPGNPAFKPGNPIGGIIVKGGKNPGGALKIMKTDENGEIDLPEEWMEGEFLIQIESKTQNSEFILTIGNKKITPKISKESHGRISDVGAPNMLVNQDGTIRNFYYEEDFQLHSDIAKYLGVEKIVTAKGYYPVDYSDKKEGGNVNLKVLNGGKAKAWMVNNRLFEGTNPKDIDCKGFGIACFYNAETGIDKKDIQYYVVKPIIEKETLIGVIISEGKKGLNAVNMKKGINQAGIK